MVAKSSTANTLINDRYLLQEQLGKGSMGEVYRAQDKLSNQTVALKSVTVSQERLVFSNRNLRSGGSSDQDNLRLALAHEFRLLASLRHPNIISVLDYGFDAERQPFFTMDYLAEAQDILKAGQDQPINIKIQLLVQVLHALSYLHHRGILHHDLKPANLQVLPEGQVKVLDFGLSTMQTQAQGITGTLAYMAPEVLGSGPLTPLSDLYSVGVIAYQLLTGSYPFDTQNPARLVAQILHSTPDCTCIEPAPLAQVIQRWLAKAPAERYPNAEAIINALYASLDLSPGGLALAAIRESYLQAARFVGRTEEMRALTQALHSTIEGSGSIWLIGGESGVGKSRLVNELRSVALVEGALVLSGQGVEGGGLPYQLWRDALRRLVLSTSLDDDAASVLKQVVPDIEQLLGRPIPAAPPLTGISQQRRISRVIVEIIRQYAQQQPVVLLLEDLHWSHESLEPLKHLKAAINAQPIPVLIICTYRSDEGPGLADNFAGSQMLQLKRLNRAEIAALASAILGPKGQQPALLDLLEKETEGNVFFIVEVMHALAQQAGKLSGITTLDLPEHIFAGGIAQIIRRRLDRVPARHQPLLRLAAVLGREIDLDLLHAAAPARAVTDWLIDCANAALLDIQEQQYYFAHDKLREAIILNLAPDEQIRLNRQAAELIEQVYPEDIGYAARLAEHWHCVGDIAKEIHYAYLTGKRLDNTNAYQPALAYFIRALTLLDEHPTIDQRLRPALLVELGLTYRSLGNYDQGMRYLENGLQVADQEVNQSTKIDALNALGGLFFRKGDYAAAEALWQQAKALAYTTNDPDRIAFTHYHFSIVAAQLGDFTKAQRELETCLEYYQAASNQWGVATAKLHLGDALRERGQYAESLPYFEEALAIFQSFSNQWGIESSLVNLGRVAYHLGEYDKAHALCTQAVTIAREIKMQWGISFALYHQARANNALGANKKASRQFREAVQIALDIQATPLLVYVAHGMAVLLAQNQQYASTYTLLTLMLAHPNCNAETRQESEALLARLAAHLSPDARAAAKKAASLTTLSTFLPRLLDE